MNRSIKFDRFYSIVIYDNDALLKCLKEDINYFANIYVP